MGAPVAQSVERLTCDCKVVGLNPGLEGGTISILSAAVPVFWKRYKTEALSQSSNDTAR